MTEIIQIIQQNLTVILTGLLILWIFRNRFLAKIYNIAIISVQEARHLMMKHPSATLFLDIRTPWELGRDPVIRKSATVPLSELSRRMEEVKQIGQGRKIVVVCRSGSRAKSAGIKLKQAGFCDVSVMEGGIMRWQAPTTPSAEKIRKKQISREVMSRL